MPKNTAKGGGWVTINGVHVFIEGGKVTKGPAKFIGSSVNDLPSGKSAEDKKAELRAKYGTTKKSVVESEKTEEAKKTEKPMTMGDYLKQQNKITGRTEPVKRGVSAQKSVAKETPNEAKSASTSSGKYANKSAKDILIERKTEAYKRGGYSASEAKELAKYVVNEEIKLSGNKSAYTKKSLSSKETLSLVHSMERSGLTDVYGRPSTKTPVQNTYGTTDRISRTAGKVSRAGTSVKTASATPTAQANFNNAVSNARKGTGSKNEKAMQKKYGKAFGIGNW